MYVFSTFQAFRINFVCLERSSIEKVTSLGLTLANAHVQSLHRTYRSLREAARGASDVKEQLFGFKTQCHLHGLVLCSV